ncbi:O-methyltransferase [Fibrella forsythiae]|uniref:O-methyltransferase n=1 Tax=Fibrella forsythiae TaxID=2817061 RepID=A0ABS3JPY0_9BACT|nr:O-methyltransferase [Fibrella forsythiae]MBO0952055.1 O-methyltransferase [Fibrella forsythiae]
MNFLPTDVATYADDHTSPEGDVLQRLNRDTYAHVLHPRMLSGHLQGRLLSMFAHMIRPRRILEIGTFTGYSAICLAEGLAEDGRLITIDKNEELESIARRYWAETPFANQIELHIGKAEAIIPTLNETFDLVFIDADKENYGLYYDLVFDKVRPGGFILSDNVLWSGKVVEPVKPADRDTKAVISFNQKIHTDSRVENILLPVRDGVLIARKL